MTVKKLREDKCKHMLLRQQIFYTRILRGKVKQLTHSTKTPYVARIDMETTQC